jgi:hypothetical protein
MMKTIAGIMMLLTMLALLPACDEGPSGPPPPEGSLFEPLTSRSAVVNNIEVAWNHRNSDKIGELLDENFVFILDPADVGGDVPESWDRAEELANSEALFTSNTAPNPTGPECERISVNFDDDEITWTPLAVSPSTFGETWYTATVYYDHTYEMKPDITYIAPPGSAAQLTVRPVGDEWRLVEWRDGAGPGVKSEGAHASSTATVSWGAIKTVYRDSEYHALTSRRAVLYDLERAWINRDAAKIDELLDDNFVFYFSPGDVGNTPEQWGRVDEMATSTALFESNTVTPANGPVCTSVQVDIQFSNVTTWVEIVPESYPDEIWYSAVVFYGFVFEMEGDLTFIAAPGSKMQLTVRKVGNQWRLVEWRDIGSSLATAGGVSQATTWGSIKALYR